MSCRENWALLTSAERQQFIAAVLHLKNVTPSVLHPATPTLHRYDDYVELHRAAMAVLPSWAHNAPAFFSWHRELLRHFEADLQAIDPAVSLPYWDWQANQGTGLPIWDPDPVAGLGTNGRTSPADFKVMDGAFAFDAGNWTVRIKDNASDPDFLTRQFTNGNTETLSTIAGDQTTTLSRTTYDSAPWWDLDAFGNFVRPNSATSVFRVWMEYNLHNLVHRWISGNMGQAASPNDPIFWLHHCNIDRLWSVWQRQHVPPSAPYLPTPPTTGVPTGHRSDEALVFTGPGQPTAPWPGSATSASVVNHHALSPGAYWYDTDWPDVISRTNSLDFQDVPQGLGGTGVTTYRAILLEVVPGPCNAVHFEIIAGPTSGFATPLGLFVDIPASESGTPATGRLWLSYTTTSGTIVGGSVTVQATARDAGGNVVWTDSWTVNLSANSVPRPKSAVALVLDRSGSMSEDAGDGNQKIAKLREAVGIFVDVMQQGDGLAIVRFDHESDLLMGVTDVGPIPAVAGSGRALAATILASSNPADTLNPRGATSIGGGVADGKAALDAAPVTVPPYSVRAMLVLTDGNENYPPSIADVEATGITANTFAIGFGTPQNVSAAALNQLTQNHDGYLLVTGTIAPSDQFRLSKYFLQVLAGVNNQQIVLDPQGTLVYGAKHRIPFTVAEADYGADVIVLTPAPGYVDFSLETPDGRSITPATPGTQPAVSFVRGQQVSYYRMSLPALSSAPTGSHAGTWHAVLGLGRKGRAPTAEVVAKQVGGGLPYSLLVHTYSCLQLHASVSQASVAPGDTVTLHARLTEYDVPVDHRARVWAEILRPDGSAFNAALLETEPGRFEGTFMAAMTGLYPIRVRASGATFYGTPFQREQRLSVGAFRGGDSVPSSDMDDLVDRLGEQTCHLLLCLLSESVIDRRLAKRLADLGFEIDAFRRCVRSFCEHKRPIPREGPAAAPAPVVTPAVRRRVLQAVAKAAKPSRRGFAVMEKPQPIKEVKRVAPPMHMVMFPSLAQARAMGKHKGKKHGKRKKKR